MWGQEIFSLKYSIDRPCRSPPGAVAPLTPPPSNPAQAIPQNIGYILREIRGSHSGAAENFSLLGQYDMSTGNCHSDGRRAFETLVTTYKSPRRNFTEDFNRLSVLC
jgi:hypothetical protein